MWGIKEIDFSKLMIKIGQWLSVGPIGFALVVFLIDGPGGELPTWLLFSITGLVVSLIWFSVFALIGLYRLFK